MYQVGGIRLDLLFGAEDGFPGGVPLYTTHAGDADYQREGGSGCFQGENESKRFQF